MTQASQTNRELEFISPLGKDVLLLQKFTAVEELGKPFQFNLQLRSTQEDIDFEALLGQNASVRLATSVSEQRYFNGHITKFSQGPNKEGFATYTATLSPWLWFLGLTRDCRIFQEQTAVDIIQAVFRDNGYSDFELRLSNEYREREYTVQYRESDFNFVSRLMEEEGIYYFFQHEEDKHTLILSDGYSSHEMIPAYTSIPFYPKDAATVRDEEVINFWEHTRQVLTGSVALNDYDFKKSRADIHNNYTYPEAHEKSDAELYDYPGRYLELDEGKHYARMRQEEIHGNYAVIKGTSTAREFTAGGLMKMDKHPRQDQNIEYLITYAIHEADQDAFGSTQKGGSGFSYSNDFKVIESHTPFRTELRPAPKVDGPQHALVVGPAGEEIYCDEYGRVKVQFPWDRYGENNENSSCWIRVSQNWAGGSWGHMAIPRIGQEVIVDFYEGNPDKPIITGRTYNDSTKVPYPLPASKTKMTIKSNTHKGTGFNELRFEDEAGQEEVFIHAQKDQNNIVLNNETTNVGVNRTENVGNDETISIGNNRTETVGVDETITIGSNRTENVGANETITIGSNRTESVGANEKIDIAINRTESVGANESISIGSNQSLKVGGNQTETVSKAKAETIALAKALSIGVGYQITVGAAMNTSVGLNSSEQVGITKKITAGNRFELQVGASSLILNKDGTILLTGKEIKISGSKHVEVNGKLVDIN